MCRVGLRTSIWILWLSGVVLSSDPGLDTCFLIIKIVSPKLNSCRPCTHPLLSKMSRNSVNGYLLFYFFVLLEITFLYLVSFILKPLTRCYQNMQKKCTELENVVCLCKHSRAKSDKDHRRFGPYTPIFLIPRTLLLSFWCGACSIRAIDESNGKSQLAKYFQNSYALEIYGG